jgi:MFS family permease
MLLALPAGAWSDMFERRRIILAALLAMLLLSLALMALDLTGHAPAAAIIALTALLACGIACFSPAMAGSIGGMVPRAELAAAVALSLVGFNLARSLGPAIGGAIVAAARAASAFAVNAVSYVLAMALFWRWQGVPFYVRTGKRLHEKSTLLTIQFKPAPHYSFPAEAAETWRPNRLSISIQPQMDICLRFQAKRPESSLDRLRQSRSLPLSPRLVSTVTITA